MTTANSVVSIKFGQIGLAVSVSDRAAVQQQEWMPVAAIADADVEADHTRLNGDVVITCSHDPDLLRMGSGNVTFSCQEPYISELI